MKCPDSFLGIKGQVYFFLDAIVDDFTSVVFCYEICQIGPVERHNFVGGSVYANKKRFKLSLGVVGGENRDCLLTMQVFCKLSMNLIAEGIHRISKELNKFN